MITEEQYESLFAFCRKHYVQYYDVQVELADHLFSAIEVCIKENPKLSFEQARDKIYSGFGIKGFSDIVASREKMMGKKCSQQKWKMFLSYFTIPKIAMTLCIYASLLLAGRFLKEVNQRAILLLVVGVGLIIFEIIYSIQTSKIFKKQQKVLLYTSGRLYDILYSGLLMQLLFTSSILNKLTITIISSLNFSLIAFLFLLVFISILAHPQFTKELYSSACKLYPKAFAS